MVAIKRERLPNRRLSETFDFESAGLRYTWTVGRFHDGRIAEIFLGNHKTNSSADTNARDRATVASLALQYGADIETIRKGSLPGQQRPRQHGIPLERLQHALTRNSDGSPSSPLGRLVDLLASGGEHRHS
jgi:hypothetical protein